MKKTFYVALLLSLCLVVFSSCAPSSQLYESFVETIANDDTGVKPEADQWTGEYFKHSCPSHLSCTFNGDTYFGTYSNSIYDFYNSYVTDFYRCEDGVQFGVRHDTGELVLLNLMTAEFFSTEPYLDEATDKENAAISMSRVIAEQFLPDINEYNMILGKPNSQVKEKDGREYSITYYFTTFARKVAGYNSSDSITVKVTSKGNLASIFLGDVGAFSDKELSIDNIKVNKSVEDKIEKVYGETPYKVLSYEILDQKLVLTKEKKAHILSEVQVELEDDGFEFDTKIIILTKVE